MKPADLSALRAALADAAPKLSKAEREDLIQEAVARALDEVGSADRAAILARAKELVPELLRERRIAMRRGNRIRAAREPDEFSSFGGAQARRRTFRRRLRVPKGTIPVVTTGAVAETELWPHAEGDVPTPELLHVAARFIEVSAGILSGAPIANSERDGLLRAYRIAFALSPADSWVQPLLLEIEAAKRSIAAREAIPNSAGTADGPRVEPSDLEFLFIGPSDQRGPNARSLKLSATRTPIAHHGDYVWEKLTVIHDGREYTSYLGAGISGSSPYGTLRDLGSSSLGTIVLLTAIGRIASIPGPVILPSYVLDPPLILWLIARMGFEGGGGPTAVKSATIRQWLLDPHALANEVERHGERIADRSDEQTSDSASTDFGELAARIRRRARTTL